MDREKLLAMIREDYRLLDVDGMKRHLALGGWLLTSDDKRKIQDSIERLSDKRITPLLRYAMTELRGKESYFTRSKKSCILELENF